MPKGKIRKGTRKAKKVVLNLEPKTFIKVWQTSATAAEAADRLKVTKEQATRKAIQYRKHKVPLKLMARGQASKVDWKSLEAYAKSVMK